MEQEKEAHKGPIWEAINTLRVDLQANTVATESVQRDVASIKTSTSELVSMFEAGKGAFKVLGWLGTIAKWVGYIAGAVAGSFAAYTAFKAGVSPAEITPK